MTQTFSGPTLAVLTKIAVTQTRTKIDGHLLASGLDKFSPGDAAFSKQALVQQSLVDARWAAQNRDNKDAHRGLLLFAKEMASVFPSPSEQPPGSLLFQLQEALLADGYDLQWDDPFVRQDIGWDSYIEIDNGQVVYHIRPTEAPGTEMAGEISALEAQLDAAGFDVALNHYKQAVDNLNHHNYEASNGALRPMLEDVTFRVAKKYGYTGNSGGNAINFMVDQKKVVPAKWGKLLQGAWEISHPEGPHPGRSNADEARFRMLITTSIVRRLMQHAGL